MFFFTTSFDIDTIPDIKNIFSKNKPDGGLWAFPSVIDELKDNYFIIDFKENTKKIIINSISDFNAISDKYKIPCISYEEILDFNALKEEFDCIIITKNALEDIYISKIFKDWGDCVLILNKDCINIVDKVVENIKPIKHNELTVSDILNSKKDKGDLKDKDKDVSSVLLSDKEIAYRKFLDKVNEMIKEFESIKNSSILDISKLLETSEFKELMLIYYYEKKSKEFILEIEKLILQIENSNLSDDLKSNGKDICYDFLGVIFSFLNYLDCISKEEDIGYKKEIHKKFVQEHSKNEISLNKSSESNTNTIDIDDIFNDKYV